MPILKRGMGALVEVDTPGVTVTAGRSRSSRSSLTSAHGALLPPV